MKNPSTLLRVLAFALLLSFGAWFVWPQGVVADSRTYTAEYVPDRVADGFDFPVGRNGSASGYYMARKMTPNGHLGDDWNGTGGGNSDYGDPVFAIADGVVVYSENFGSNWGQVIIVRHKYREGASVKQVDSLYGHVINRRVSMGNSVRRGQQIAQIGNNNGMYLAHLHLEIRRNTEIGIQAWNYSKGLSNYCRPDQFIASHRPGKSIDANLRLASTDAAPAPAPAPAPVVKAPATVAAAAPMTVASVETPRAVEAKAKPASDSNQGYFVAYASGRAVKQDSRDAPVEAAFRGSRKTRVVDELAQPSKSRRNNSAEEKSGAGLFASLGQPQRMRRSREVAAEEPPKVRATKAKHTTHRRRSFGKQ
jgi:hypothetical protein